MSLNQSKTVRNTNKKILKNSRNFEGGTEQNDNSKIIIKKSLI